METTYYKAHKQDYYCREKPYRIFKSGSFWKVQPTRGLKDTELFAEALKEAKEYVKATQ